MMIRILTLLGILMTLSHSDAQDQSWRELYKPGQVSDADGNVLRYRLLSPPDLDKSSGKSYPLVVFLHGAGERGDDNDKQLVHCASEFAKPERREKEPCFVVFPQCAAKEKWAEVDWSQSNVSFDDGPGTQMRLVFQLVDQLIAEQPIDQGRLYVAGLSMGGYGTWHAIGLRPKFWAAAIPVCGGADLNWTDKFSDTPIWVVHGDKDQAVPVENSRRVVAKLRQSQVSVVYSEYPGVGHDSWTRTFADQKIHDWLFAQRRRKQ